MWREAKIRGNTEAFSKTDVDADGNFSNCNRLRLSC
jgi:hypothetical protein